MAKKEQCSCGGKCHEQEQEVQEVSIGQYCEEFFVRSRTIFVSYNRAIDAELFSELTQKLMLLSGLSIEEPITIILNSIGGDLYNSLGIYDAIRHCPCPIHIVCYGACMSGGSLILQAADRRVMAKNCTMLVHYGSRGFEGTHSNFKSWANDFERTEKLMLDIYTKKMKGKKKAEVMHKMLKEDTILSADDALKYGLIDEVLE